MQLRRLPMPGNQWLSAIDLAYSSNHLLSKKRAIIMIERIHANERSSKSVKHNGVVYLTGQVAEGDTI